MRKISCDYIMYVCTSTDQALQIMIARVASHYRQAKYALKIFNYSFQQYFFLHLCIIPKTIYSLEWFQMSMAR